MTPKVSFIIPTRPNENPDQALKHIKSLQYPPELIEVILTAGYQPSLQRNEAARQASGSILYFIDDDSLLDSHAILEGLKYLKKDSVVAVGGPALTQQDNHFLQKVFGEAMGAFWGGFTTRFRHQSQGQPRPVRGEELILCNLMVKKEPFLAASGFNQFLYPGEDPEFFKRMRHQGHQFYYNPGMIVHRPRRKNTFEFFVQNFRYGKGRAHHLLRKFSWADGVFLIPSLFIFYLCLFFSGKLPLSAAPLYFYLLMIIGNSITIGIKKRNPLLALFIFPHIFIMHMSYGLGILSGFFRFRHKNPISSPLPHLARVTL